MVVAADGAIRWWAQDEEGGATGPWGSGEGVQQQDLEAEGWDPVLLVVAASADGVIGYAEQRIHRERRVWEEFQTTSP